MLCYRVVYTNMYFKLPITRNADVSSLLKITAQITESTLCSWDEHELSFQKTLKIKFLTSLLPHSKYSQHEVTIHFPSLYFYGFDYQ